MKHISIFLIVLFGFTALTSAQSEPDLYIYVQVNPFELSNMGVGEANLAEEVVLASHDFFAETELEVVFLTTEDDSGALSENVPIFDDMDDYEGVFLPQAPTLSLRIDPFGDLDGVFFSAFAGYAHGGALPMSIHGMSGTINVGRDNESRIQDVVTAVAGAGGYVARACDFALPYIKDTLANGVVIDEGLAIMPGFNFYLGSCAYQTGDVEQAIEALETAITFEREQPEDTIDIADPPETDSRMFTFHAAINLAWLYEQQGDDDAALALLHDFTDVQTFSFTGRELPAILAQIELFAVLSDEEAAFREFAVLVERAENELTAYGDAEHARIYAERGRLHAQLGNIEDALADYARAIEVDPTYPKVYFYRAQLHESEGDTEAASSDYETFIELADGFYSYYEEDLTPYLEQAGQ